MGMFDYVTYPSQCPYCKAFVSDFQSKDGDCTLSMLTPRDVRTFYGTCPECKEWIAYEVVPPQDLNIRLIKSEEK